MIGRPANPDAVDEVAVRRAVERHPARPVGRPLSRGEMREVAWRLRERGVIEPSAIARHAGCSQRTALDLLDDS